MIPTVASRDRRRPSELSDRRAEILSALDESGIVLLQGFAESEDDLKEARDILFPRTTSYAGGNSPRTKLDASWYTSTEYPKQYAISMHNELSYLERAPMYLAFFCVRPADRGGATPVASGESLLRRLGAEVRAAFAAGVRYVQNLPSGRGVGRSWQDTFETDSREEVEGYLRESGAKYEWRDRGKLRVVHVRPSTRLDRQGSEVWFNQADQWHWSNLDDATARSLRSLVKDEDELPLHATFADSSPIPVELLERVRSTAAEVSIPIRWEPGSIALVDNVRWLHGREAFEGERKVLVALTDQEHPF
jgi:alpha-ketoglutarate-dependent taurine dioxygenase